MAFHVGDDETLVWALPHAGELRFAQVAIGAKALAERIGRLRAALDPEIETIGEIPPFDLAEAHALYRDLLAPVAAAWQGAEHLLVVPHRALAQLPFGLLLTAPHEVAAGSEKLLFSGYRAVPWLMRQVALSRYPSVNGLVSIRKRPPIATPRRTPRGPGRSSVQPGAGEARAGGNHRIGRSIARGGARAWRSGAAACPRPGASRVLSWQPCRACRIPPTRRRRSPRHSVPIRKTDLFVRDQANEAVAKSAALEGRRVIVFATYGLLAGDLDGLTQPALALTAPEVAGVEGDGLLTMGEIIKSEARCRLDRALGLQHRRRRRQGGGGGLGARPRLLLCRRPRLAGQPTGRWKPARPAT